MEDLNEFGIAGIISEQINITHGVLQKSILALLLSIFTADLPEVLTQGCLIHMYADYILLYSSNCTTVDNTINILNQNLETVRQYSIGKKYEIKILNSSKTTALCIETRYGQLEAASAKTTDMKVNNFVINISACAKSFCVTLDSNLCFEKHVKKM